VGSNPSRRARIWR